MAWLTDLLKTGKPYRVSVNENRIRNAALFPGSFQILIGKRPFLISHYLVRGATRHASKKKHYGQDGISLHPDIIFCC